jgi:hypothetical protein
VKIANFDPSSIFFLLPSLFHCLISQNNPFIQWQEYFIRDLKEVILFDEIAAGITIVVMHDWSAEEGDVMK